MAKGMCSSYWLNIIKAHILSCPKLHSKVVGSTRGEKFGEAIIILTHSIFVVI